MDYKLSAELRGHEDDVRAVTLPDPSFVLSASRDATVRVWRLKTQTPPVYDDSLSSHGTAFINAVAYVPPSTDNPEGLVVSGGKDAIIEVRQPQRAPQDNADALLLGHTSNICALDVSEDGKFIISGSWDATARIWQVGKWETSKELQGHQGSVWAVLAYDQDTFITGCADKTVRLFSPSGQVRVNIAAGTDVVRALCKLPNTHSSGAAFASAGNDGIIHLWTLQGVEVAQLHGHEAFIYSLAVISGDEIASSSEDRTVRIWKGNQCLQTITHPAISVWSVASCSKNGDIATGASDRIVRVFSRAAERQADAAGIKAFEDSVKGSAIPQQQVGNINKEELPGPDFITNKSGTKEGQVQMIKEYNGSVTAYTWSTAAQQWVNVGTVVDSAGSSGRKVNHNGKDYDFVFDVDIEDGKPPLKLPFNLSQNPYEAARKFIEDNELPISYLDQVTNFIVTNTQGATFGQSSGSQQMQGADPWGTESRYRPGDVDAPSQPQAPAQRPKILPQTQYLSISNANLKMITKKVLEFNQQLIENGAKDLSLNPSDQDVLNATAGQLEQSSPKLTLDGVNLIVKIATSWPQDKRLPALDLLRLTASSSAFLTTTSSASATIIATLASSDVFSASASANNTMLAVRTLVNLSASNEGRLVLDGTFEQTRDMLAPHVANSAALKQNRNLAVALTTLFINYAVLLRSSASPERGLTLLEDLSGLIGRIDDAEALYRALVALGTVLSNGQDEVREAARSVFEVSKLLTRAESVGKEPRVKNVASEIRDLI